MLNEGVTIEEARSKIWLYDIHGLLVEVSGRFDYAIYFNCIFTIQGRPQGDLGGAKAPYVKKGPPMKDLMSVVDHVKPSVLLGKNNRLNNDIF